MANILLIETATQVCSVGVSKNGNLLALRESTDQRSHSEMITTFIEEVLIESNLNFQLLDAVAVSKGPGSYTGLRIGVSTAKAVCFAKDIPLIAIDTLQSMSAGMILINSTQLSPDDLLCPMIDARRMEVYASLMDVNNDVVLETDAHIIDDESFKEYLNKHQLWFFGDGAAKCKKTFMHHPNAVFVDDFFPSVKYMSMFAEKLFQKNDFEDLAYFEPFYLKDFIAGMPKVKGLYA